MIAHSKETYIPDSRRELEGARVICFILDRPEDLISNNDNLVLDVLAKSGMSGCTGVYFYRFTDNSIPFIKIGETTRPGGIAKRFSAGWHGKGTDSYTTQRRGKAEVESEFLKAVNKISSDNLAYFVFYEHPLVWSHTKADEMYSMVMHERYFGKGTINGERANKNRLLGRKLVFHKSAFSEVLNAKFPSGEPYINLGYKVLHRKNY